MQNTPKKQTAKNIANQPNKQTAKAWQTIQIHGKPSRTNKLQKTRQTKPTKQKYRKNMANQAEQTKLTKKLRSRAKWCPPEGIMEQQTQK